MEYQVGDTVVYGIHGVCRIEELKQDDDQEYYILKPIYDDKATLFVPKGNPKIEEKMRRILSKEEIYQLIHEVPQETMSWIQNENARKEYYKAILTKGERRELMCLIKMLYLHQKEQAQQGKKLYKMDEKFMKEAEKMLHEEFAHVLHIEPEQVGAFIMREIELQD